MSAPAAAVATPASPPVGVQCTLSWHAFVSPFYPVAYVDGVAFTFANLGDRPVSGVGVTLAYLGRTLHFTDDVTLAKSARESHSHPIATKMQYVGREAACAVERVTFADGTTFTPAPAATPAR